MAACLSLSLQLENTLLFRPALTAPFPPPYGLSSQKLKLVVQENRTEKGEEDKSKRGEVRQGEKKDDGAKERVSY